MRLKVCKNCKESLPLTSFTSTQARYCNPCKKLVFYEKQRQSTLRQIERLKNKPKKTTKNKTLPELRKSTQWHVNAFVRRRDTTKGCISCMNGPVEHAGHYVSCGASGYLRFHPDNIHGQCSKCNTYLSGNLIEYRIGLIQRIGQKKLEFLENNRKNIHQYEREQLQAIIKACKENIYTHTTWDEIIWKGNYGI